MSKRELSIRVPVLARVEGEGALELDIRAGAVEHLHLRIFEPPRLFEKFVEGHGRDEVVDMVARICGICPVAYQMTAVQAFEQLSAIDPGPWVRSMRRVMYCGEWIQSHSLHIHLLALPDFLGFSDALSMAASFPEEVRRGLRLQTLGNDLIALFGGRSVHPVGLRVGGFYHAPDPIKVEQLELRLQQALPEAEALLQWAASTLRLPQDDQDFVSVALGGVNEYPMGEGRILSDQGLNIAPDEYEQYFEEFHVSHSTALHAKLQGKPYLVGPLARINLNLDLLPDGVRSALHATGVRFPSRNMFHSLIARAVELLLAIHEALRLLRDYQEVAPSVPVPPKKGVCFGVTEAPRGILWHRYECDEHGRVTAARIVPPTSQNQARMEEDIRLSLEAFGLDHEEDALRLRAEQVIRNYDPCISCATHFLKLSVRR